MTIIKNGSTSLDVTIETITPEVAKKYLGENRGNRKISDTVVDQYATDMRNDAWLLDGTAIIFDKLGVLRQGQHRLTACVKADKPFTTLVVRGVERQSQIVMDTGKKRLMSDVLHFEGVKGYAPQIGALLVLQYQYMHNGDYKLGSLTMPTRQQQLALFRTDPDEFTRAAEVGNSVYVRAGKAIPKSLLSAAYYVLSKIDADDADRFFNMIGGEVPTGKGHPVWALMRAMRDQRASASGDRRKIMALIFKAWNAYRNGDEIQVLQFRAGGANPEKFPEVK